MIKRFFLAALAAVALTMGFTACSEEDEYKPFAGDYKLSGFVDVIGNNIDYDEMDHIQDTYRKAFGITDEGCEFTINGKDSADCVSNILICCKNAEAKLAGQNWSGYYSAEAKSQNGKTSFYTQEYGKSGENDGDEIFYYSFGKTVSIDKYYSAKGNGVYWENRVHSDIPENTFITGFATYWHGTSDFCSGDLPWVFTTWHNEARLNRSDAGLYLLIPGASYTSDEVRAMVKKNDPKLNTLIGDVKVLYLDSDNYPQAFTYKGAKYEVCGSNYDGSGSPIDLNIQSGGHYMYLYVSHDVKHFGRVLDGGSTLFCKRYGSNLFYEDTKGPRPETSELVQGIYMNGNGNLSDHYEDGIDFQLGAGNFSPFLKMRTCYVPLDEFGEELEAVDLGLPTGTKWASKNVGASIAEDYGYYFAWGETAPFGKQDRSNAQNYSSTGSYDKLRFEWSTYKWCNGTQIVSKYNQDDYMTVLEPEDDAATVNLGEHWRTPYKSDIRELIDGCDWTWTTQNGVTGYQVKSKTNGNSIFLPAAGYRSKNDLLGEEDYVYIWSANCDFDVPYRAYYMSRSTKGYSINTEQRYLGLPIRAVYVE